jgi:hypothetical protein
MLKGIEYFDKALAVNPKAEKVIQGLRYGVMTG